MKSIDFIAKTVFFMSLILAFLDGQAAADEIYVSTLGDDLGDGTIESPFPTLARALDEASPGDNIVMRGGTFTESEIWYTGSGGETGRYITIRAFPGEAAILSGGRLIIESKYIRIENLRFVNNVIAVRRWEGRGYQMSHHIEFLNNNFSSDNVTIYFNCNNGLIENNVFDSAYYAVYLMHGDGNIIRGNRISNTSSYSIHVYDENKYQYAGEHDPRITNLLIEKNIIFGSQTRTGIIVSAGESTRLGIHIDGVTIRNNVISSNAAGGIGILYYGSVRNVEIYNNTIYGNSNCGIRIYPMEESENLAVVNNIFSNNAVDHACINAAASPVFNNNLYWAPETVGTGVSDSAAVFGNPLFENPDLNDFHLQENSEAIDVAVDMGLVEDLEGNPRPLLDGFDVGAYEHPSDQPLQTCLELSGNCCSSGQTCISGTFQASSDCGQMCCVGGTCQAESQTCQSQGHLCCDACQSGSHPEYDGDCPSQVCCESCSSTCPDGICDESENCDNCAQDCGPCCGNGICESIYNETCDNCADDCPTDPSQVCCLGAVHSGDCCQDEDCTGADETCVEYRCRSQATLDGSSCHCGGRRQPQTCPLGSLFLLGLVLSWISLARRTRKR